MRLSWGMELHHSSAQEEKLTRLFFRGSLVVDGHLIVLGEDGNLAAAEANPEAYVQRSSFQFSQRRCWSVPVLADSKLYMRDEEQIVCYDLKNR